MSPLNHTIANPLQNMLQHSPLVIVIVSDHATEEVRAGTKRWLYKGWIWRIVGLTNLFNFSLWQIAR